MTVLVTRWGGSIEDPTIDDLKRALAELDVEFENIKREPCPFE